MTISKYISIDSQNIHVNIIGEGEPIIFLHGGPGSEHRFFLPHVLPLSKKFQLVLYDQQGCGKSDPIADHNYSMDKEVETLEAIRKELKLDKMSLFGESWGSMLALLYAAEYPEHVNKLFLTAAIGINQKGFRKFKKELLKRISLRDKIKLIKTERNVKKGTVSTDEYLDILDPYYVFSKEILATKEKISMNHNVNEWMVNDIEENYDLTDKVDVLANIPILIAQGTHDILTPSMIKDLLVTHLPHAELIEIDNCGHWTVIEKPNEINKMVEDFLLKEYIRQ